MSSDGDGERDGVRVLRALGDALAGADALAPAIAAAARALVPGLADACTIRCADATGRDVEIAAGVAPAEARILELPLDGGGALRLARAGWDDDACRLAEACAARLDAAIERDRLVAAAETARLYDGFLATLSHELRTPLNVIVGWADLLRGDRLAGDRRAQAIEVIERNARVQVRLIEDLLEVSRIVTGKLRLEIADVPMRDVVVGVVEGMRPQAEAAKLALELVADTAFTLRGDGVRLSQVVHNLVGNAIRYSPPGGRIDVTLTTDGRTATLVVADAGVGIAAELLPHVFERFRQGERRRSGGTRGLGLGLYIVRHIVHLHGGTVEAASDGPGRGATFTVRLPLAAP